MTQNKNNTCLSEKKINNFNQSDIQRRIRKTTEKFT